MTAQHPVPLKVLDAHLAILGKTGAGKSYALRGLIETLLDNKRRVCIVDPKGDHWGIKSSHDGKKAGYSVVIFGGDHADVPLNARNGKEIAELVATGNRPCVIDFRGWMPGDRTRFWIDFASTLFRVNKSPLSLILDEVHNFAPQGKVLDPDAGKCLHWTNRIGTEGRGMGITVAMASQRPQKVHKDLLTCAETLIAMRVIHPLDRGAMKEWIDGCGDAERGKMVLNSLAEMPRGEAFVWSPEIGFFERLTFPVIKTFDSFKAPSGDVKQAAPSGWAEVNLDDVKKKLSSAIEEAKANDPELLKKRIRELEHGKVKQIDESAVTRAMERGKQEALRESALSIKALEAAIKSRDALIDKQRITMKRAAETLIGVAVDLPAFPPPAATVPPVGWHSAPARPQPKAAVDIDTSVQIKDGARRMLVAAVRCGQAGIPLVQMKTQAGILHSDTVSKYRGGLMRAGYLEQRGDVYIATEAGVEFVGGRMDAPVTTDEVLALWMPHFKDGVRRMLRALIARRGEFMTAEDLMREADISHPDTYSKYRSKLKSASLLVEEGGMVAANKETLFL